MTLHVSIERDGEGRSTRAYARWKTGAMHGPSAVKNQGDDSFSCSDTPSSF